MPAENRQQEPKENVTEPNGAEQIPSLGEGQFRLLIENASDVITVLDGAGAIRYQSPALKRILGHEPEDVTGQDIFEFIHPDDLLDFGRTLDDAIREPGTTQAVETRFRHRDGSWRVLESICSSLPERSRSSGVVVNSRDVTERKQAEEALKRSEERYALAQRAANIGSWDWNVQTGTLRWSDAIEPMFGFSRGEFGATYEAFLDCVHPEDRQYVIESVDACVEAEENYNIEHRIVWPDGTIRWVSEAGDVFRDEHGQAIRMMGIVQDITERKQAEEALRRYGEEQALLYTVASTITALPSTEDSLFALLDVVLPVLNSEAGWVTLPGATLDDPPRIVAWRGVSDAFIQAEMTTPLCDCPVCAPLLTGGEAQAEPALMAHCPRLPPAALADSNLHSHVAIPLSAGDKVLGILEIAWRTPHPYTERDHALLIAIGQQIGVALENIRLQQQSQQLAVMEERQRLARELHDSVTQSVYSLTLFAEAGQEWAEAGDLDRIRHDLTRIGEIAQQALKDMRLLVYELQPSNLEREGLIGALHHRLNAVEKRAGVEARLLTDQMVELPSSVEEALYGVAQEALNNALKHADARSVLVYIRFSDEHVELEVVDDGKGFAPDAASDKGGLGLTTMRERVEKVGGSLTILSTPGKGTRVKASIGIDADTGRRFPSSGAS